MLKFNSYLAALTVFVSLNCLAATPFRPTTTLTIETSNNTSAADQFAGQPNGNVAPSNISKVPIQSLLYPGATTKVYAHLMPWFGFGDHVDVGYNSSDALQVQKQVTDMISRGLDGVIVDWYGRGAFRNFADYNQGLQALMLEAEKHPGFTFAVMEDVGALKDCAANRSCNFTENLIADLNYAHRTYQGSPAYMQYNGRPVVFFFGLNAANVDWHQVKSRVAGNPLFVFRNAGAFSHEASDGGYSWVYSGGDKHNQQTGSGKGPDQNSNPLKLDLHVLDSYYDTAKHHTDSLAIGSGYKGFDDSIALWSDNRFLDQHCGQTWLQSIAESGQYYSETSQLTGLQLVTWNDYEEGTEFETGIDNCIKLSAGVRGTNLQWSLAGDESTIDHYTIFVSQDGENLMPLANAAAGQHSIDVASFNLDPADYKLFVKAVGKPSMTNKMSNPAHIAINSNRSADGASNIILNVTPSSAAATQQVTASIAASSPQATGGSMIDFGDGTIVTGQLEATHVYRLAGSYTIMATVTTANGASSTQLVPIVVTERQ